MRYRTVGEKLLVRPIKDKSKIIIESGSGPMRAELVENSNPMLALKTGTVVWFYVSDATLFTPEKEELFIIDYKDLLVIEEK